MHAMLFTTINGNPAHPNLSGQSKRKGAGCPHCLKDTCVVWLRHSKKYIFMGHHHFLGKKHPYRAMDCQFNGEKENREAPLHTNNHTSMSLEMQNHTQIIFIIDTSKGYKAAIMFIITRHYHDEEHRYKLRKRDILHDEICKITHTDRPCSQVDLACLSCPSVDRQR
jgi:hypothetical protein